MANESNYTPLKDASQSFKNINDTRIHNNLCKFYLVKRLSFTFVNAIHNISQLVTYLMFH